MVSLTLFGFKLFKGQGFYAYGHCDLDLRLGVGTSSKESNKSLSNKSGFTVQINKRNS